jgi:DNA repair exonuclease SbcCD nuclease subunit
MPPMVSFIVPVIGDAHFKSDARQEDRLRSVDQIIDECFPEPVGFWAIPGDLFDGISDVASRNAWLDRVKRMKAKAPVVICYGNHDRDGDLYYLADSKFFTNSYPVYVLDRPTTFDLVTPQLFSVRVFALPYPHPSGLVADGTPPDAVVATAAAMLDVIFMDAGAKLMQAEALCLPTLMIGHANVSGSRMSTGQPLIGKEIELDAGMLQRLGSCPKILNHIHFPQEIGGAVEVGSVTAMSWGEVEPKRYIKVIYGHDSLRWTWTWDVVSVPLRTPRLVHVNATFDNLSFEYDIQPSDVPPQSDVRVRITFKESERLFYEHGRGQVLDAFVHARRVFLDPICEADTGLRSPEVAAAVTLVEKIEAWAHVVGLQVPDIASAVAELETKTPDEVVLACERRLDALMKGTDGSIES